MPRKPGAWDSFHGQVGDDIVLDTAITRHARARAWQRGFAVDTLATATNTVRAGTQGRTVVTVLPTVQKPLTLPGTIFKSDGSLPRGIIKGDVLPPRSSAAGSAKPLAVLAPKVPSAVTSLCWNQAAVSGRESARLDRWRRDRLVHVMIEDDKYGGRAALYDDNVPPRPDQVQSVLEEVQRRAFAGKPARPKLPAAKLQLGVCSPGHIMGSQKRNLRRWESQHSVRVVVGREEHSAAFRKHFSGQVLLYDLLTQAGESGAGGGAAVTMPDNVMAVLTAIKKLIKVGHRSYEREQKQAAERATAAAAAAAAAVDLHAGPGAGTGGGDPGRQAVVSTSRMSAQHLPANMLPPEVESDEEA